MQGGGERRLQPSTGVKINIPGLERVCQWWMDKDEQVGFLGFLGFWLGDGHLIITHRQVGIAQRTLLSTEWLIDLLDSVFHAVGTATSVFPTPMAPPSITASPARRCTTTSV